MATIKAYTTTEQSRKLAEILPLESADMSWVSNGLGKPFARTIPIKGDPEELCGCWSLAALLGVLPEYNLQRTDWGNKTEYKIVVYVKEASYASKNYDNPVDACYELILKLNELNLL